MMKLLKKNLIPALIILLAGLLVSFAAIPLQNTAWAENTRAEVGSEGGVGEALGEEGEPSSEVSGEIPSGVPGGVLTMILPLVKVIIFMGIGGLLTALALWIIRLFMRPQAKASTSP